MEAKEEKKKKGLLLIILFFIILITLVSNRTLRSKVNDLFFRQDKSLQLVNSLNVTWPEDGKVKIYDDVIIRYGDSMLSAYDFKGSQIWSENINNGSTLVYLGEDKLYITYIGSGKTMAYGLNGVKLWTYDAMQEINQIAERNGYLVLFTKAGETIEQINIVNGEGKLKANTTVNVGSILSCNILPNQKGFALSTLDLSSGSISSSLIYYDMNGKEIWKNDYTDQIIYDVLFLDNDNMIVVYNNKIANIDLDDDLLWSRDIEGGLKDIELDADNKRVYLLYGQATSTLESISPNGRTVNKIELDSDYDNIYIDDSNILINGSKNIAGVDDEEIFLKYNCDDEIKGLGIHEDNILIFTSENTMITETISINLEKAGD